MTHLVKIYASSLFDFYTQSAQEKKRYLFFMFKYRKSVKISLFSIVGFRNHRYRDDFIEKISNSNLEDSLLW